MKKCVVSFADNAGSYQKKMLRLEQSLKDVKFDGDFLGFTSYNQIDSNPTSESPYKLICDHHSEVPYQFKAFSINKAIEMGYDLILWLDSPIYAKKSIQPVFDHIEQNDYVFFDNIGFSLGDFTNDKTLDYFKISRQDSWSIKMIMACAMGFNRMSITVTEVLHEYINTSHFLYPGEWDNDDLTESKDRRVRGHRHDQSVMSALIHKYRLNILKGQDTFFAYEAHRQVMPIADSVCLFSE